MYTREADHGIPRIISRAAIVNPPLRALDIRQNSSGLDDEGLSPVFFLFFLFPPIRFRREKKTRLTAKDNYPSVEFY